jgi:hypothetical protein
MAPAARNSFQGSTRAVPIRQTKRSTAAAWSRGPVRCLRRFAASQHDSRRRVPPSPSPGFETREWACDLPARTH